MLLLFLTIIVLHSTPKKTQCQQQKCIDYCANRSIIDLVQHERSRKMKRIDYLVAYSSIGVVGLTAGISYYYPLIADNFAITLLFITVIVVAIIAAGE